MSLPSPKEFYGKYCGDPEEGKRAAFMYGIELGNLLKKKIDDPKQDLETVAALLNLFQDTVQGEPNAKVEKGKVLMTCSGFCPVMRAAMTLNLPWIWLDENLAWPMTRGLASVIIPGIKLTVPLTKSRGDSKCIYIFET